MVSLQQIFKDKWSGFTNLFPVRDIVNHEVNKVISCGDRKMGFALYECSCGNFKYVPFRCKSKLCNSCGYAYQQLRAQKIKAALINCTHRHIVFTIAEELRVFFRRDRSLLDLLFRAASDTLLSWFRDQSKKESFTPGIVATLHTFGRDLKWNPHIHILVTEMAAGRITEYRKFDFFPYEMLRKRFMTTLLFYLRKVIPKYIIDTLYKTKDNGFYVYAKPNLNSNTDVVNYIVRYVGRPVIAKKRILSYDGNNVTFCYNRHEDNKYVEEVVPVYDFIKKVIVHVPDKYFNMVRYYGLYHKASTLKSKFRLRCNPLPKHILRQLNLWFIRILRDFHYHPLRCTCGKLMTFSGIHLNSS